MPWRTRASSWASASTSRAAPRRPSATTAWPSPATIPLQFLPVQQGTVKAIPLLEAAAKGNGSVNTDLETVVIRRVPMLFRLAGQDGVFPALSIEAMRVAQGANSYVIKSSGANQRGVVRHQERHRRHQDRRSRGPHGRARAHDPLRHRPSQRALRLGGRRAEGNGAGRQDRRPDRLHRHQRDRPEGHAQHAGRRCRARCRGPRPARRADADAGLPRPAGFRRRRGIPLSRADRHPIRGAAAAPVGRPHGDCRRDLHRHRARRPVVRLLGISTCCSIRSIRR